MQANRTLYALSFVAAIASLQGCSILEVERGRAKAESDHEAADERFGLTHAKPTEVVVSRGPESFYISKKALLVQDLGLPSSLTGPMAMSIEDGATAAALLKRIGIATGLGFSVVDGAPATLKVDNGLKVFAAGFSFNGTGAELLDRIATACDCSWRYKGGGIEFFKTETKVYKIATTSGKKAGTTSSDSKVGVGNDGFKNDIEIDAFNDVEEGVKRLLTPSGNVYRNNFLRSLTVTDEPRVQRRVAEYIEQANADMSKQVKIEVDVFTVDVAKNNSTSVSLDAVMAGGNFTRTFTEGLASPTVFYKQAVTSDTNKWTGSSAVISALGQLGTVSVKNAVSQTVMNGSVIPLANTRQISYISKISTVVTQGVSGSQTSVEQATATEGFSTTLRASVLAGDAIMLSGTLNISTVKLQERTISGSTLQIPTVSINSSPMEVMLKSGQEYLFGYKFESVNSDESGFGGPMRYLPLAGSNSANTTEKIVVVKVVAKLVDSAGQY